MLWEEIHAFDWSRRLYLLWDFCLWKEMTKTRWWWSAVFRYQKQNDEITTEKILLYSFKNDSLPSFAGFTLTFGVSATVRAEGEKNSQHSLLFETLTVAASAQQQQQQQRLPFCSGTALTFPVGTETFLRETSATAIDKASDYRGSNLEVWAWVEPSVTSGTHRLTRVRKYLTHLQRVVPVCAETALALDSLTSKVRIEMSKAVALSFPTEGGAARMWGKTHLFSRPPISPSASAQWHFWERPPPSLQGKAR